MTPPRTRSDVASPATPKAGPDQSSWPTVWTFDTDEMTAMEKDIAMRACGVSASTLDERFNSYMAAAAVVLARRQHPDVPLDHWKQLKGRDIRTVEPVDLDAETDPTQPL